MVRVPALYSGGLVVCLMDISEVVEAAAVYGESDVIVKIETSSPELRDSVIMGKIRKIPYVEFTRTYAVTQFQLSRIGMTVVSLSYAMIIGFSCDNMIRPSQQKICNDANRLRRLCNILQKIEWKYYKVALLPI